MFSSFLALSILFWFLSKLSKEYTHTIEFKTRYINGANDKVLQNIPLGKIELTLKSHGFNFLSYKLNRPKLKINLANIKKLKNENYYYLTNTHFSDLQSQISSEISIIAIKPDTLFFDFGMLKVKKVKVKPILKLNFKNGFNLTEKIKIEPEYVTITGPEKKIDSIVQITTDEIVINGLHKGFSKTVNLKITDNIDYSSNKVKIIAEIEKFTEGSLILDYKIINIPENINVKTFTKKINITYRVSLKNFDKVFKEDFKVICDFEKTSNAGLNYLLPVFVKKSPFISDLKINPKRIEYLIKK